jgi:hypothetical protein
METISNGKRVVRYWNKHRLCCLVAFYQLFLVLCFDNSHTPPRHALGKTNLKDTIDTNLFCSKRAEQALILALQRLISTAPPMSHLFVLWRGSLTASAWYATGTNIDCVVCCFFRLGFPFPVSRGVSLNKVYYNWSQKSRVNPKKERELALTFE